MTKSTPNPIYILPFIKPLGFNFNTTNMMNMDTNWFMVGVIMIVVSIVSYIGLSLMRRSSSSSSSSSSSLSKSIRKLVVPPGSLGWPYIGETLQLYSQHPDVFLSTRYKRYGDIFKTHILGCPCVMLGSPEAARFVLVTHAHLFKPTYPKSKENLIGPSALFFHQGDYHTRLRKLVQGSLYPDSLRLLVPAIQDLTVSALASWADGRVVNTYTQLKMVHPFYLIQSCICDTTIVTISKFVTKLVTRFN